MLPVLGKPGVGSPCAVILVIPSHPSVFLSSPVCSLITASLLKRISLFPVLHFPLNLLLACLCLFLLDLSTASSFSFLVAS